MQSITTRAAFLRRVALAASLSLTLGGCAVATSPPEGAAPNKASASYDSPGTPDQAFNRLSDSIGTSAVDSVKATLMAEYESWKGTPYRLGGESAAGIDCSALVQRIFRDGLDLDLPRSTSGQALIGRRIDRDALKTGDLVFFKPSRSGRHVGIYLGEGRFLHASSSKGVRISHLDNPYWQRHYWQSRRASGASALALHAS